jgi:type I restriction enzyme S subunit
MVIALNRPIINGKIKIGILSEKDSPSILYQRVGKIIFKSKEIDRHFLFYIFLGEDFKRELYKFLIGTDQPYIRTPIFLKIKIPLPPLPEQKKIAEILSTVDRRLELLKQKKERLQRVKKGLMNELLTGKRRVRL